MANYNSTSLGNCLSKLFQIPFTGSENTTLTDYKNDDGTLLEYVLHSSGPKLQNSGYNQIDKDISTILQPITGEHLYNIPGTFTWTCPVNVTSISVLCIGGGGGTYNKNKVIPSNESENSANSANTTISCEVHITDTGDTHDTHDIIETTNISNPE